MIRVPTHALLDLGSEEDGVLQVKQLDLESNGSPDLQFSFGSFASWGGKAKMEDRVVAQDLSGMDAFAGASRVVLLGVFDGHNGDEAAEYLQTHFVSRLLDVLEALRTYMGQQQQQSGVHTPQHAVGRANGDSTAIASPTASGSGPRPPRSPSSHHLLVGSGSSQFDYGSVLRGTLLSLESELLAAGLQAGSTALVALLVDGLLFVANVGDCRAVVSDDAEARVLTWDHKPSTHERERERVQAQGGTVTEDGYVSMDGSSDVLMLSRALGDAHLKAHPPPVQLLPVVSGDQQSMSVPLPGSLSQVPAVGSPQAVSPSAAAVAAIPPSGAAPLTTSAALIPDPVLALHQGPTSPTAPPPLRPLLSQASAGLALCRSCSVSSCQSLDAGQVTAGPSYTSSVPPAAAVLAPGSVSDVPLQWPAGRPALVIPAPSSAATSLSGAPAGGVRYRSDNGSQGGALPDTARNSNSMTPLLLLQPALNKAMAAANGGQPPLQQQQQGVVPAFDACSVASGSHSPEPASSLPSAAPSPAPDSERILSPAGSMQPQAGDSIGTFPAGEASLVAGSSFNSRQATSSVLGLLPLPSLRHGSEPGQAAVWGSALPLHHQPSGLRPLVPTSSSGALNLGGVCASCNKPLVAVLCSPSSALSSAAAGAVSSPSRSFVSPRLRGSPSQPALLLPTSNSASGGGGTHSSVSASGAGSPTASGLSASGAAQPQPQFRLPFSLPSFPSIFMRRSAQQVPPAPVALQLQGSGSSALTASRAGSLSASQQGLLPFPPDVSPSPGVVIPDPDVIQYAVHQESEFMILASDGVWDTVTNKDAVTKVRRWLMDGMSPEEAARELVNMSLKLGSTDNASAVVLRFSSRPLPRPASNSMLRRARSEAVMPSGGPPSLTTSGVSSPGVDGGLLGSFSSQRPAGVLPSSGSGPQLTSSQRSPQDAAAAGADGSVASQGSQFLLPQQRGLLGVHSPNETCTLSSELFPSKLTKSRGGSSTTILEEGGHQEPLLSTYPQHQRQLPHRPSASAGHTLYSPTAHANQSRQPSSPSASSPVTEAQLGSFQIMSAGAGSAGPVGGGGPLDAHSKGVSQLLPYWAPV